jgi:steroid delta-isomerase-like uncharacterized protein
MSTEANKQLVNRFFDEVCNGRKLDVADQLFTTTHRYNDPAIPGVPPGPDGMKQVIATYQNGFSNAHWQVEDQFAEGNTVVTRWTGQGTQDGELNGIPPTQRPVRVPGIWIHRIENGKIAESSNVWDTLGMLQQLGVIPATGGN